MDVERITPQEIFDKVQSGEIMLVCAYDSDDKFRQLHLEGAISLEEFKAKEDDLSKNREIVFYCA
jgi:rhodanese-related sulfurtransferase